MDVAPPYKDGTAAARRPRRVRQLARGAGVVPLGGAAPADRGGVGGGGDRGGGGGRGGGRRAGGERDAACRRQAPLAMGRGAAGPSACQSRFRLHGTGRR